MELGLQGKHIFITGSSGGIGLETARLFLKEGSNVTLHYSSKLDPLTDLINEFPNNTFVTQANATDEPSIINSLDEAVKKFGVIHVMIANHAIFSPVSTPLKDMSLDRFKNTLDVNLVGTFLFVREWLRKLQEYVDEHKTNELEGVNCVIIGSTSGLFGERGHVDYSCSKSALTYGFTKTLKNEIPNIIKNARVNVVAPGWVLTPMAQQCIDVDPSVIPKALQTVALRKIATPLEVANSIAFLASSAASHISGCVLEIHGGMEGRCLNPL